MLNLTIDDVVIDLENDVIDTERMTDILTPNVQNNQVGNLRNNLLAVLSAYYRVNDQDAVVEFRVTLV